MKTVNGKDEVTGEIVNGGGGELVIDWDWSLCNGAFENGVVPEDWKSIVIVPCTWVKGEKTKYKE